MVVLMMALSSRLLLALLPLTVLWMAGCTFSQQKDVQWDQYQLLEQQQSTLDEQGKQLQGLLQSQIFLTDQLSTLQDRVEDMHAVMTREQQPVVSDQSSDELVATLSEDRRETLESDNGRDATKALIGRVEWLWLDLSGQRFKARIDTGAATSSLSASHIQAFERNGENWVRFKIPASSRDAFIETPLLRYKKIRQASSSSATERRPIVRLRARLGAITEDVEFNLTDRNSMLYPVLLGRSFLQDIAVVDVSQKFTQPKVDLAPQ